MRASVWALVGGLLSACGASPRAGATSTSAIDGTDGAAGAAVVAGNATAGSGASASLARGGAGTSSAGATNIGASGRNGASAGASAASLGGRAASAAGTGASGASAAGTNSAGMDASGASAGARAAALAPAQGALLGLYYGDASLAATAMKLGRTPPIHLVYWAFADDWTGASTRADLNAGRIPLVNWEPDGIDFNAIVNGSLDATIDARASGAKQLAGKFFLDFAAEMNGDEAWSGNDAPLYVAAYRRLHDRFRAAQADNVIWAWCPNVADVRGGNAMTLDYYPGDDYVDWTCVDGYNWGTQNGGWQSFQEVFAAIYPLLAQKGKPILIGEMASTELGGDKAAWIDQIVPSLKTDFPAIKALVWFDVNKETDWRISSSPAAEAAFKRLAADPYLNP